MAEPTPPQDSGLPLGDIALDMVRKGDKGGEPLKIHPRGADVLKAAVRATFLSGEADDAMAKRFRSVILVCYVLDEKKNAPNAAAVLAKALFEDPRVAKVINATGVKDRTRGREYRKFLDEGDLARAPKIDEAAPDDAVKLKSFLTPGQDLASQARRTKTKAVDAGFKLKDERKPPRKPAKSRALDTEKTERRAPGAGLPPHARKG